jgi:hypothetical protein
VNTGDSVDIVGLSEEKNVFYSNWCWNV